MSDTPIDTSNVTIITTAQEGTDLVTRDDKGNIIDSVPLPVEVINANELDAKVDDALAACIDYQTKVSAARTAVDNLQKIATTKSTTATSTATEIRNLYSGVSTVCTQIDAMLVAEDNFSKAVAIALRLISGRLDDVSGT